ncbi:MAG TPA: BatD family protein [Candidatus Binatia bacterium]|jgi:tetratricopeptide (TPR) repeat protein
MAGPRRRRAAAGLAAGVLLLVAAGAARAADVSVHAGLDRNQISVGDAADLSVTADGVQDAQAPSIGNVDGLSIRYVGPSSQMSITNGRVAASITHHFSVAGLKPGGYTIAPIAIEYEGKRYEAGAVSLRVVAGAAGAAAAGDSGEALTLTLTTTRTRAYLHERLPAVLTLTVGAVQVADVHYPTVGGDGFAVDPLHEPTQRRQQTTHGSVQIVDFATTITPLRAGALTVGPATMELSVPARQQRGDPFFRQFFGVERRPVTLNSVPLQLDVLPLPDTGKPADFSGAVGHFTMQVEAGPRQLAAGDPVTVTAKISGDGSLDGIHPPAFAESDALKVYPPRAVPQPGSSPGAAPPPAPPAAIFEQVVIPEHPGSVTLPPLRFSYFDPEAGAYRTIAGPAIALTVQAAAHAAEPVVGATVAPAALAKPAETLGHDIVFIKDAPGELRPIGRHLYRSPLFWAAQLVPLTTWIGVALWDRRRRRRHADPRWVRFSGAGRSVRRAIANAETALRAGDHPGFYDRLARAMSEYLSAKLDLPPGTMTADAVAAHARARGVPAEVADGLRELFATCEHVRFAPGSDSAGDVRDTLARAESLVRALERERRLGTAPVRAAMLVALAAGLAGAALARADGGAASPNTIFFHGNALYGEERYADAAAEYLRVLAAGLESGPLYFNLGNAYFRAGDVGHAVLAYERALRLMPGDPDLRANLRFARGTEEDEGPLLGRLLFPLATRVTADTLCLVASLLFALLLALRIAARLLPTQGRLATRAATVAALALVVVGSSAAYRLATVDLPAYAVVVAPQGTTVRFEPSAGGTVHFEAKTGNVLRVLVTRERWAQVVRPDGTRGWIETSAIEPL